VPMPKATIRNGAAMLAAMVLVLPAGAQVHKCVDAAGKVSFSDAPCPASAKQSQRVMGEEATSTYDPYAHERTMQSYERDSAINRAYAPQLNSGGNAAAMDAGRTGSGPGPRSAFAPQYEDQPQTENSRRGPIGGSREGNPNWSPRRGYYGGGGPADQRYEADQAARRVSAPGQMVNCDSAGCWGANNGVRYNSAGGGNLIGTNGSFCTNAGGGMFHCN